ncbi:MAG: glycosyltransferase, partial [Actinomycetota bacterium]|nr:glycosyltransferase [Actinomycetota bacterium]
MIGRVAYLSVHTSPLAQPGVGDAGGMNVYIDELARTMAGRGITVDVFTRAATRAWPAEVEVFPGYRVVHVPAGPRRPLGLPALAGRVGAFAEGVVAWSEREQASYDIIHSHYWLSGWAGVLVKKALDAPLANSFHTLGRVKDAHRVPGEPPESLLRIAAEQEVIDRSDCLISSTPAEADDLLERYGADPAKVCVSPPGVDHEVFVPGPKAQARRFLGLGDQPLLLFVGRIQPLKGLDVAVGALEMLVEDIPSARMLVVGGPSGRRGAAELERVRRRIERAGLQRQVTFLSPQVHHSLATFYQAADALLVPSRSESFGLVAVEAQACGLPVVAAKVGGLAYVVE